MTRTCARSNEQKQDLKLADWSDESLIQRYQAEQDRRAFDVLVHRYEQELYNYLRRYLGDAEQAEDVFQATFLQVHLKCDQYQQEKAFRPWLYAIATHQAIDAQRRSKRHRSVSLDQRGAGTGEDEVGALIDLIESREGAPEAAFDLAQHQQWVQAQLQLLPAPYRAVIDLVYYQGLKYRETADALGVPLGTVKSRLHAALARINEAWNKRTPVEQD